MESLRLTPLQAGVLVFLCRHPEATVTDAVEALIVRVPTASGALSDLVQKRWVTKRCSVTDSRVVHVRLSGRGEALTRQVEQRVSQVNAMQAEEGHNSLGLTPRGRYTRLLRLPPLLQYTSLRGLMPFLIRPYRWFPFQRPFQGHGTVWNLSPAGVRLSGDLPMRPEESLSLTVTLPNEQRIEISQAVVRWVNGYDRMHTGQAPALCHTISSFRGA